MNREICMDQLGKFAKRVQDFNWENEDCYASWLSQTYHFVSHSTRLISLAASRFYTDKDKLHQRFIDHISEEKFHERLASRDIKNIGKDLKDYPELNTTKVFYQSQYYEIERESPESFLGYILALEGIAVLAGEGVTKRVVDTHKSTAASFLKVHAEEDKEHIESAFEHMLSLDEDNLEKAYVNFIKSGELYCRMLDEIEEKYSAESKRSVA